MVSVTATVVSAPAASVGTDAVPENPSLDMSFTVVAAADPVPPFLILIVTGFCSRAKTLPPAVPPATKFGMMFSTVRSGGVDDAVTVIVLLAVPSPTPLVAVSFAV